jgi:hypothetical protein
VLSFDLEPARRLYPNSFHSAFELHPSALRLRLLSMYQYVYLPDRWWDPRHPAICCDTDLSFDPEPVRQLLPNSCHRAFVPNPSALRLWRASTLSADAGIHGFMPSVATLIIRSTRNQRGNCFPILATVRLYRILQLCVLGVSPITRASTRPVDAGIQDILPSVFTLTFRSTRNHRGNCSPILATVRFYRNLQLDVFIF